MEDWRQIMRSLYPDLEHQTYCVPPVYFKRVAYDIETFAGQTVLVTKSESADGCSESEQSPSHNGKSGSGKTSGANASPSPLKASTKGKSNRKSKSAKGNPQDLSVSTTIAETTSTPKVTAKPKRFLQKKDITGTTEIHEVIPAPSFPEERFEGGTASSVERAEKALTVSASEASYSGSEGGHLSQLEKRQLSELTDYHAPETDGHEAELSAYSMWTRPLAPPDEIVTLEKADDSSSRDDFAQQHVLHCLQKFGSERGEVMFIVSQLVFSDYLNKPSYAAAAARLPKPINLPRDYRRGDFDILIVHSRYGILLAEVKSVGFKADVLGKSPADRDADVARRVPVALKQLEKGEKVVRHILKDILPGVVVRKTLILPYVSGEQLHRVLNGDANLSNKMCEVLEATDAESATDLCMCSDQLSPRDSPWHVSPFVLQQMAAWFDRRMDAVDTNMTFDIYLDIVARLAGPATTVRVHCVIPPRVEVRTLGQAVSESGERVAQIVLTPAQIGLLNRSPKIVYLTGPPGTGKTLMLVLKGLQWLRQGSDVHVISTRLPNLAASNLIRHQLEMTLKGSTTSPEEAGTVHFHQFDINEDNDLAEMKETLVAAQQDGRLFILLDEADMFLSNFGGRLRRVINDFQRLIPHLHLWAASMYRIEGTHEQPVEYLTVPLSRFARAGTSSAFQLLLWEHAPVYHRQHPPPCDHDGPGVIQLRHQGPSHSGRWPMECTQCGLDVARVLKKLRVGEKGVSGVSFGINAPTELPSAPPPLQYRDVIVLTRSSELRDDVTDDEGNLLTPGCGFVNGLKEAGVPPFVLERDCAKSKWKEGVLDMSLAAYNKVTVTHFSAALGLERKVVVYLQGRKKGDEQQTDEYVDAEDRVLAVSRCLSQLIVVDIPR